MGDQNQQIQSPQPPTSTAVQQPESPIPTQQQPTQQTFRKKWLKWIILGLAIFLIILVVTLALSQGKTQTAGIVLPTPEIYEPSPTHDPNADWKTYKNDKIGISFTYPSEWEALTEHQEACDINSKSVITYVGKPCVAINLTSTAFNRPFLAVPSKQFPEYVPSRDRYWGDAASTGMKNPEEFIKTYCTKSKPSQIFSCITRMTANGFIYVKSLEDVKAPGDANTIKGYNYFILNKNDDFPIILLSNRGSLDKMSLKDSEKQFDNIVTTLKSTDQTNTADWKTYANIKYGYSVKYPTNAKYSENNTSVYDYTEFFEGCFSIYAIPKGNITASIDGHAVIPFKQLANLENINIGQKISITDSNIKIDSNNTGITNTYTKLPSKPISSLDWNAFNETNNFENHGVSEFYTITKNDYHYVIDTLIGGPCPTNEIDLMLSTFKFTK